MSIVVKTENGEIADINNLKDNVIYKVYGDDRYLYSFKCNNGSAKYNDKKLSWYEWFISIF